MLVISFALNAQCNNCAKNFGGWIYDDTVGMKKTNDGFLFVYHYDDSYTYSKLRKYDFNCNLLWEKTEVIHSLTVDDYGNIYTLGTDGYHMNYVNKLTKYNSNGTMIWQKQFTGEVGRLAKNILIHQNTLIVTGVYRYNLSFGTINFINNSGLTSPYARGFLAKYDTDGNFFNAIQLGQNIELFKDTAIDNNGNIYVSKVDANFTFSKIEKYDSNLQLILSKEISNNTGVYWAYCPTNLHYNKLNNKMYVYGSFSIATKIDNVNFSTGNPNNGIIQSIISEFDVNTLNMTRYLQYYNNSMLQIPHEHNNNPHTLNNVYFTESSDYLYGFGSFSKDMTLGNTTISSSSSTYAGYTYHHEDLVLFRINLLTFQPEVLFKSNSATQPFQTWVPNAADEIFIHNNEVYVSANFSAKPIEMNGSLITNNSGNGNTDVLFYKYTGNSQNSVSSNSPVCPSKNILLNATGGTTYSWTGPNGFTSNQQNPVISNANISSNGIYYCTISGSTTGCNGTFPVNVIVGDNLAPVPNQATLPTVTGDCNTTISNFPTATDNCAGTITATTTDPLSYYTPGTYTIHWSYNDGNGNISTQNQNVTVSLPAAPTTINTQQVFCASDQPTLSDVQISGQNVVWTDVTGTVIIANDPPLVNGETYYAYSTVNGCQSNTISIQVTVNNTPLPTANTNQDFCASANPTLANLIVNGTALIFYDAAGNVLPLTIPLINGQIYYVTQTLNACKSDKLAITVTLSQNNVPATNYRETLCNVTTAMMMTVNLNSYQSNMIANPANYIFTYTNQAGNPILNPSSYILNPGSNIINVKVATADGCFKNVILELVLNPKPSVTLPEDFHICEGKSVVLDAGSGFVTYLWNTGATTQTITVSTAGTYSVKVTNSFGCENTDNIVLSYSTLSQITAVNITGNTAAVIVSPSGIYEYSLDNASWQDSNIFTQLEMGEYTVYVRTKDGCFIGQKPFSIFNIPNAISPNGDNVNDIWKIAGLQNYKGSEVSVYDRKGALVFRQIINKTPLEWNGKINGAPVPTGNYWYTIKVSDGRNYSGWLLIKNRN